MLTTEFRKRLLNNLGGDWPKPGPLNVTFRKEIPQDGFTIHSLTYDSEPNDPIPALLLIPDNVKANSPAPAIAIWHQHAGQYHLGKSEPAGLDGNPMHHTGAALAREGYVVLCPDALCFEERQDPEKKRKGMTFERFEFLRYVVSGQCLAWKNILDMKRAIDFLVSIPEVDSKNIGCYGHSMGSTHTWLVGPWEERIRCFVANCCLPTYRGIHRNKMLHCFPNFIPGLNEYGDTPDIAALIAPRPLHFNFGKLDTGTPAEDIPWSMERIQKAYREMNAENNHSYYIEEESGHILSDKMWTKTKSFFEKHLKEG
jgi:dienelactone hydrolase